MKKIIVVTAFLLLLSACSSFGGPTSPAIPTLTAPAVPLLSPTLNSTNIALPPTATAVLVIEITSTGKAATEWNGVPVMPGAITGEGDQEGYVFTIHGTSQQVQEYYKLELGRLGWQLSAQEDDSSSQILIFFNSVSETLTVTILVKGEEALVLLAK